MARPAPRDLFLLKKKKMSSKLVVLIWVVLSVAVTLFLGRVSLAEKITLDLSSEPTKNDLETLRELYQNDEVKIKYVKTKTFLK